MLEKYSYIPVISLKPAEMAALEELPIKDKSILLPLIPLKKWANSKSFEKSLERINKALGDNYYVADIDKDFLFGVRNNSSSCADEVIDVFMKLSLSDSGYRNWVDFIEENELLIPTIQFEDISQLSDQIDNFLEINKPIVARFEFFGSNAISASDFYEAVKVLSRKQYANGLLIIFDYGDVNRFDLLEYSKYSALIKRIHSILPSAFFSLSGTSFPYSFAGSYRGEIPIYERQIFNKVSSDCQGIPLIYSDRASTRALSNIGGAGVPPPRIDYPLRNDWRFIRKEFTNDFSDKESLYKSAAQEILRADYWNHDLHLWGTQMIEKTSVGDRYGITSASRATAVRINLHLYQQLHYHDDLEKLDTEDEWID